MGWFWQGSGPSNTTPTATSPTPPTQAPTPTPPPSSADAADNEMTKFLEMIQSEMQSSKPADQSLLPSTRSSAAEQSKESEQQPPPRAAGRTAASQAISESLLPTDMSCRDAFDYAWHCHTPGSQWNAVYRYGSVRSCTELWDDFWFCMRTKGYKGELKEALTRAHYRAKEAAKYGPGKPSSEDVWESREEKVAPGTAFGERVDGPEENDREWQVKEIERRRTVRERMGFDKDDSQAGK